MEYITNYAALQTTSPPAEMYVRDSELTDLRQTLEPITEGHRAPGVVIYGPSGAGKTHAAKLIIQQLEGAIAETNERRNGRFEPTVASEHGPDDLTSTHIDCWDHSSAVAIIKRILSELGHDGWPSNTPRYELMDELRNALECPYIVILDEADQIADDGVLKQLHQIPEITLLCIVNEYRTFLRALEMSVESRIEGLVDVEFDGYSEDQLVEILEGRIDHGVGPGVVPDEIVDLLASVSKHDARRAIDNLRKSVHKARDRGMDEITPTVVREAVPETERELIEKTITKLTRDQRILYEILVEDGGEMSISEVYDEFLDRAPDRDPASKRTAKRQLIKMSYYHLVDYSGENSARRYEAATDVLYLEEPA